MKEEHLTQEFIDAQVGSSQFSHIEVEESTATIVMEDARGVPTNTKWPVASPARLVKYCEWQHINCHDNRPTGAEEA